MKQALINEDVVKNAIFNILNEEAVKVKRDDFNRVQYKIEELENSLSETIKQLRKLQDCVPDGLKTVCNGRINAIMENLNDAQKFTNVLKFKVKKHKKAVFSQQVEEKKK